MKFSNPRHEATIEDWPIGGNKRGTCVFRVESDPKKGQRVSRVTTGKPKYTTYAKQWRIVDGDDARTYLIAWNPNYGSVTVMSSDMQHNAPNFDDLPYYIAKDHARFKEVVELFTSTIKPE